MHSRVHSPLSRFVSSVRPRIPQHLKAGVNSLSVFFVLFSSASLHSKHSLSCGLICIIQFPVCFFKGTSTYKYHARGPVRENNTERYAQSVGSHSGSGLCRAPAVAPPRPRLPALPAVQGRLPPARPARTRREGGAPSPSRHVPSVGRRSLGCDVTRPRPHHSDIIRAARHFVSSVSFAVGSVGGSILVHRRAAGTRVYCLCLTP